MTVKRFLDSPNSLAMCEKGIQSLGGGTEATFYLLWSASPLTNFLVGDFKYLPFKLYPKRPFLSSLTVCRLISAELFKQN